jgi:exosortase A-associated hydrolase 2
LALDLWRDHPRRFASALLWQPVANGENFMTQFLRLAIAGEALRDMGSGLTTNALRQRVAAGETIEVAGYALAPALVAAIDQLRLTDYCVPQATLHWLEVKSGSPGGPLPATQRVLAAWEEKAMRANFEAITGDPFWTTQEIVEVPALITASIARYRESAT